MSNNMHLFTTRMRKATRQIHSISDALVNAKFAISLQDEKVWGGGLFVFYHIFAFLEDAKERLNMPEMNKLFVHEILYRKEAFESDLTHYLGDDWKILPTSTALDTYIEHLQDLEMEDPKLLIAYVYHLYLGLLSGGQILAKKRKMFGDKKPEKNIYSDNVTDFNDVDIGQLKKNFRQAMNEIADKMTEQEQETLLEESNVVFVLNNHIVNSVGGQNSVLYNLFFKAFAVALLITGVVLAYKLQR